MVGGSQVAGALEQALAVLESPVTSTRDELRSLVRARRAIDAAVADRLRELDESREFEAEGCSSVCAWARLHLHQDAGETRQLLKHARTHRDLPAVGEAARSGAISSEHSRQFTFTLNHVDREVVTGLEHELLAVAKAGEPRELKAVVQRLRAVTCPDELDEAWLRGMDKQDLRISPVMDGWHVTGFLSQHVGARFHALLTSWAVPRDADDSRTPAERRLAGLDDLLSRELDGGVTSDGSVPPQVHVLVDAGQLRKAVAPTENPLFEARGIAELTGFGPIGPGLTSFLTCGSTLTPVLVDRIGPNQQVLDVGRSSRLATPKQREALHVLQRGRCAAPGCRHPISTAHHVQYWSDGGPTDLANLIGLCSSCHRTVHAGTLQIRRVRDEWEFRDRRGRPIDAAPRAA